MIRGTVSDCQPFYKLQMDKIEMRSYTHPEQVVTSVRRSYSSVWQCGGHSRDPFHRPLCSPVGTWGVGGQQITIFLTGVLFIIPIRHFWRWNLFSCSTITIRVSWNCSLTYILFRDLKVKPIECLTVTLRSRDAWNLQLKSGPICTWECSHQRYEGNHTQSIKVYLKRRIRCAISNVSQAYVKIIWT